jgi:hypothetical protein
MLRRLFNLLPATLAALALFGAAAMLNPAWLASADPVVAGLVFPPGLRIGLQPPGDMTVSKHFAGFEDTDRKAAIALLDLPEAAYQQIERSAFAQGQKELTGLKRESFPFANGIGVLVSGAATEKGVVIHKWFLMATAVGGPVHNLALLASAQVPEPASQVYTDAAIRKALASITFRPTPIQEQLGLIPFTLSELAGFKVVQVMPAGGVVLTDGPSDDIARQPYMIVTVGRNAPSNPDDRARLARDMLADAPLRDLNIQNAESMRITGAPGFELRGQAEGPGAAPVSVVQWLRFSGSGYLRIIGVAGRADWNALFTRFRAVRDGIAFR